MGRHRMESRRKKSNCLYWMFHSLTRQCIYATFDPVLTKCWTLMLNTFPIIILSLEKVVNGVLSSSSCEKLYILCRHTVYLGTERLPLYGKRKRTHLNTHTSGESTTRYYATYTMQLTLCKLNRRHTSKTVPIDSHEDTEPFTTFSIDENDIIIRII